MSCSDFFPQRKNTHVDMIVKVRRRALKQGWLLACRPKPTADNERWDEHVDMMARSARGRRRYAMNVDEKLYTSSNL